MNFRKSESFQLPTEVDENSSPHGVYIRKNIVEEVYTDPETGDTCPVWRYEEAFVSHVEYSNITTTQYAIETSNTSTDSSTSVSEEEIIDNYTEQLIEEGVI